MTSSQYSVHLKREPVSADLLLAKTDAGIEVHQRLGPYIRASALTARMKLSTRAVNMVYIIRDYSPMTIVLAMAFLPLVLFPTSEVDDIFNSIAAKHGILLVITRRLFLAAYLARSFHSYVTYRHIDPSHAENFHSMELWSAPCESISAFSPTPSLDHAEQQNQLNCAPPSLPRLPSPPRQHHNNCKSVPN